MSLLEDAPIVNDYSKRMRKYELIFIFLQNSMMMQDEKLVDYSIENFEKIIHSDWVLNIAITLLHETSYSCKREATYLLGNLTSLMVHSVA